MDVWLQSIAVVNHQWPQTHADTAPYITLALSNFHSSLICSLHIPFQPDKQHEIASKGGKAGGSKTKEDTEQDE